MVKMRHKGLLVLGITRQELNALREGAPLPVSLSDLHPSLKGQNVLLIPGEDNRSLERVLQMAATAYENGATSVIEIAKTLPRTQ
jgi:hypothetical protein